MTKSQLVRYIESSLRSMDGMKLTYAQKAEYLITQINTLNSGVIEFQDEETEDKKVA